MLSRRNRGNVLFMVICIFFLLLTIVVTLFQVNSVSWTETMRTQTELQSRQLARFALLRELRGVDVHPPDLPVKLSDSYDHSLLQRHWAAPILTQRPAPLKTAETLQYDANHS